MKVALLIIETILIVLFWCQINTIYQVVTHYQFTKDLDIFTLILIVLLAVRLFVKGELIKKDHA